MEPATITAATVVALLFSEAAKEWGKSLAKGTSGALQQLWGVVQDKFEQADMAGVLTRAEDAPTEKNIGKVKGELEDFLQDEAFAQQLRKLILELQATEDGQVMLSGLKLSGSLQAQNLIQKGNSRQIMLTDIEAENITVGDMTQES